MRVTTRSSSPRAKTATVDVRRLRRRRPGAGLDRADLPAPAVVGGRAPEAAEAVGAVACPEGSACQVSISASGTGSPLAVEHRAGDPDRARAPPGTTSGRPATAARSRSTGRPSARASSTSCALLERRRRRAAQHDVAAERQRPVGSCRLEVERADHPLARARVVAHRVEDRVVARTAGRPGSTSASRAAARTRGRRARSGCARAARRCRGCPTDRRPGWIVMKPKRPSASVRQRPTPVKFGSSGAGCWSPAWR